MKVDNPDSLVSEIERLKREKGAVILAHYYQRPEIQDVADYIGDSLALARIAAGLGEARIVVMCGVYFMAETVALLCPGKKVLIPDASAGCSLADSCPAQEFAEFVAAHPGHTVVSYVNTSAAVKAHTDIVVTSGNALKIINALPADEKIIFGPDRNLGNYINNSTGRNMVLWPGACHVHSGFSAEKTAQLKKQHPDAPVLVHPECQRQMVILADKVGSTAALLDFVKKSDAREFIVATEAGIIHQMKKECPDKIFLPAPADDSTCGCNDCSYMKLVTLEKLRDCLRDEKPVVEVDPDIAKAALRPIEKMLEMS